MTMQKEKMRSLKRRMQQLLMMSIEATQGKEMGQNDQKWPGARRSSAALWRGLQEFSSPNVIQESTHQQRLLAEHQRRFCACSWKYPVFEVFKKNSEICTNKSQVIGSPHSIMSWKKSRETSKL